MANRLKMAMVHTIHTLLQRGWSRRRIARALGIDRETVGRYARLAAAAPPGGGPPTLGSADTVPEVSGLPFDDREDLSKPAGAPLGSAGRRNWS